MSNFETLLPERICDNMAHQGLFPTGALFQLNSYENRVYQVQLENKTQVITKFYRVGRWSQATLVDEHRTLAALAAAEVPVVQPMTLKHSQGFDSLGFDGTYYYCVYPKFGGHEKSELDGESRTWLGRLLARLHNITDHLNIEHRLELNTQNYGDTQLASIMKNNYVPPELKNYLVDMINRCLELIDPLLEAYWDPIAVHGDCHLGNVLWNPAGPTLVDFDDMVLAPAIQDVWMLFYGSSEEQQIQKKDFFSGYEMFRDFDHGSFAIAEALRTLRMIRHTAWIGERFNEEIFKRTFSYYTEVRYWENFLQSIKEQLALLQQVD